MAGKTQTPATPKPKRPWWRRKRLWIPVATLALLVALVGPWPTYDESFEGTDYARSTFDRLDKLDLTLTHGPLTAAAASVDITPRLGEPLAGYSARNPMQNDGAMDCLHVKALSFSNGRDTVTIVGGDVLLVLPALRQAILQKLALDPREVYITATHTHSGPGGYSPRWVDQISLGRYDEEVLERLADAFAEVVARSRSRLRPARIAVTHVPGGPGGPGGPKTVANRLDPSAEGNASATCLRVWGADGEAIGGLVTFNAHPTCMGRRSRKASGDYPGDLQRGLQDQTGGVWLFAAGAVGSMKVVSGRPRGPQRLADVSRRVLSLVGPMAQSTTQPAVAAELRRRCSPSQAGACRFSPMRREVSLAAAILDVDLPPLQVRIGRNWRLSPVVSRYLHGRSSYIHVLRINELVLLGMPCDYSGELSERLERRSGGLIPVVTSFNGDYIGYLIPRERYSLDHYESRSINFFGPACGEFFHALSVRLLDRLAGAGGAYEGAS